MARKEDEKLTLVSSEFVKSIAEEAEIQIDNEKVTFLYNFNRTDCFSRYYSNWLKM